MHNQNEQNPNYLTLLAKTLMTQLSYKTDRKAVLIGKNAKAEAILIDLSMNKAGVITTRGAKEGTQLELEFEVPAFGEFTILRLKTRVIHRHNSEDDIYLKLEFTGLTTYEESVLSDFLEYKQRLHEMGKKKHIQ